MPRQKFLQQRQVADRLAMDAKKMLRDRVELPASRIVLERWEQVRADIRAFARGVWEQTGARDNPLTAENAKQRIAAFMNTNLLGFRNWVVDVVNNAKMQAYEHQFLTDHWILDQVTPPNIQVRLKRNPKEYKPTGGFRRKMGVKEAWYDEGYGSGGAGGGGQWFDQPIAGRTDFKADDKVTPIASHEMRFDLYLKAWAMAAFTGLAIAAIQGDEPEEVELRIEDAKTADGHRMETVLSRLIKTEVQVSIADSDDAFEEDFKDLVKRRYWKTMEDERVCPICRPNEGRTEAHATHGIPAHVGCRCYWRMEAVSFKTLAGIFGVGRLGSGVMAVRDPRTGELTGTAVIDFEGWKQTALA